MRAVQVEDAPWSILGQLRDGGSANAEMFVDEMAQ